MSLNKISINDTTTVNIGIVYDISKAHNGSTYTDLADALGTDGENVPLEVREGGMSVKFIQTSDNKYVQYRLMSNIWSTTVNDWQGVDDEPTVDSNNMVKSSGVYNSINSLGMSNKIEEFIIYDNNGNIAFRIDNEGLKAKKYYVVNENGTKAFIDGTMLSNIKENIFFSNKKFIIYDEAGNIALIVDNDGLSVSKICIKDNNGNILFELTQQMFDDINVDIASKQKKSWIAGMNLFMLGDSLGQNHYIQNNIATYTGCVIYPEFISAVLNSGGTQSMNRYPFEQSGQERAKYLKQIRDNFDHSIDIVMFESNNDSGLAAERPGLPSQEPYFENQILVNDSISLTDDNYRSYINNNISTILQNAKKVISTVRTWSVSHTYGTTGDFSAMAHSLLYIPFYYEDLRSYKLSVLGNATSSGTLIISASGISGFIPANITIAADDTINDIRNKILQCDFGTVLDMEDGDGNIIFTDYEYPDNLVISISGSSADIESLFSLEQNIGGYINKPFVYKSLDTSHWNDGTYWVLRDTEYQPEYNAQENVYGPTFWQVMKGTIEYILTNFTDVYLVGTFPTTCWPATTKYSGTDVINYYAYKNTSTQVKYNAQIELLRSIFEYYSCKFIDLNKVSSLCGINAVASGFYNSNDIHPNNSGYQRWGEIYSLELL